MDIDVLWSLGGCCFLTIIFIHKSMATSITNSLSQISTKSHHYHPLFAFVSLILLLMILLAHSSGPSTPSSTPILTQSRKLSSDTAGSTTSMAHLHAKRITRDSSRMEFKAGAHEVPSGPNPIQN